VTAAPWAALCLAALLILPSAAASAQDTSAPASAMATPLGAIAPSVTLAPSVMFAVSTTVTQVGPGVSSAYAPVTPRERVDWIVDGVAGRRSLGVGVVAAAWQTALDTPDEWRRSWPGFGKRYIAREADVALSNALEAGVGALWGEEPRYIRSRRRGFWPRTRYALRTVLLAQRRDGHLAPAWGRYVGNTVNNVIENSWLPPSVSTVGQTVLRSANGFLGRVASNVFEEFWPDAQRLIRQR
jgi:hypothetical protein